MNTNFKLKGTLFPFFAISIIAHLLILSFTHLNINYSVRNNFYNVIFLKNRHIDGNIKGNEKQSPGKNFKQEATTVKTMSHPEYSFQAKSQIALKKIKNIPKIQKDSLNKRGLKELAKIKYYQASKSTSISTNKQLTVNNNSDINIKSINFYKENIIKLISDKIKYPYIAKKRGYEGSFLFELKIDKSGKLLSYSILKEQGNDILKKAAVKTILSINYPQHNFDKLNLEIPVIFKLIN